MSNTSNIKIGIIGCGKMGQAIVKALLISELCEEISIYDSEKSKMTDTSEFGGVNAVSLEELCLRSDFIVLAVKPQNFSELSVSLTKHIKNQTIISIMAGVSILKIEKVLNEAPIARVMPNLGAFCLESMTCICVNRLLKDSTTVKLIFKSLGKVRFVDEKYFDIITAVSGSGPAYLFLLAEAVERAAVDLGLDNETAKELIIQTMFGAVKIMKEYEFNEFSDLIESVASKGGTTEAALNYLYSNKIPNYLGEAVKKSASRSSELEGLA